MFVASEEATSGSVIRKEGLEPLFLVLGRAIALQNLHISGVRRRTIEDLGGEEGFPHFLSQIGVFHGIQPIPVLRIREPEIPQASLFGLFLQRFQYLGLTRRESKTVAALGLADLREILLVQRHDFIADHVPDRGVDRLETLSHTQRHVICASDDIGHVFLPFSARPEPRAPPPSDGKLRFFAVSTVAAGEHTTEYVVNWPQMRH